MEDLANSWRNLSLSEKEGDKLDLKNKKKGQNFVLATKFFTRRSLNVEAVAKTFRPLWRIRDNFEVSDAGNNCLLFAFQSEEDIQKVLMGEPWSFDKHIVVFQRYNPSIPVEALQFDRVCFWIQIHNLPYSHLTKEVALSVGESLGPVIMPGDESEWRGGNFLRVRVAIDVSEPLCRGRRVEFDEDKEGWMSFTYERMPNLCYWCGLLMHDEKDCAIWLRSKGTLSSSDQQFGPWIRADQFNSSKKFVVEVQGYEKFKSKKTHNEGRSTSASFMVQSKSQELTVMAESDANSGRVVDSEGAKKLGQPQSLENFQAVLQEIDEALQGDNVFQNSKQVALESSLSMPPLVHTHHTHGEA